VRLLPSLKSLVWQSLSAAPLQSGAPFAETRHFMRPVTMEGLARRDRVSPASYARAFKSSMASLGLFSVGRIDSDFSNIFPISLISPGFSSRAGGGDDGAGSPGVAAARSGVVCWAGVGTPREDDGDEEDVETACGQQAPVALINIDSAMPAVASCVLDRAIRLPDRSSMTSNVA
jgi:hypothetical protein